MAIKEKDPNLNKALVDNLTIILEKGEIEGQINPFVEEICSVGGVAEL